MDILIIIIFDKLNHSNILHLSIKIIVILKIVTLKINQYNWSMLLSLFDTKEFVFDEFVGIEVYALLRDAFDDIGSKAFIKSN